MYYVYIMCDQLNRILYTGVTNDLIRRVSEHKSKSIGGFTSKYNINKLVNFEEGSNIKAVISREKQIKAGSRKKKLDLINSKNPEWIDLYDQLL